jgi:Uma2 family endonuclease
LIFLYGGDRSFFECPNAAARKSSGRKPLCRDGIDIKVRLKEADCYYPDVVVTCDPQDVMGAEDYIHSPKLVIEVLSKSTAKFDRGEKFTDYQTCPKLEEYVLVSQTERSIEVRSLLDGSAGGDVW